MELQQVINTLVSSGFNPWQRPDGFLQYTLATRCFDYYQVRKIVIIADGVVRGAEWNNPDDLKEKPQWEILKTFADVQEFIKR